MNTNGVVEYWNIRARDFQSSYHETGPLWGHQAVYNDFRNACPLGAYGSDPGRLLKRQFKIHCAILSMTNRTLWFAA